MKLIETDRYIVNQHVPYFYLGDVHTKEYNFNYEDYPNVFSKVYEFETGEITYIGQQVFRIKGDKIKHVYLTKDNLELEIFPTTESAQNFLDSQLEKVKEENIEKKYKQSLMQIKILSNIKEIESISLNEIKKTFNNINNLCSNV